MILCKRHPILLLIEFGSRRSFIATDGAVIFDVEQTPGAGSLLFQYGSPTVADLYGQRKTIRLIHRLEHADACGLPSPANLSCR